MEFCGPKIFDKWEENELLPQGILISTSYYRDVITDTMASQITSLTIVHLTAYSAQIK